MANVQVGYGHGDVVGVPFDFYAGTALVTGSTITMQTAVLVLLPGGAVSLTINLPLNPVDGAWAEIVNASGSVVTLTAVNANTGDSLAGATTPATLPAATQTPLVTTSIKYRYSLNGDILKGANPRTWVRVQ